jgi:hypothetical protein
MEKIFKAKRLDNGEWVEFTLGSLFLLIETGGKLEIYKKTISQYTGINDSEGNRIFEGDRVYVAGVGKVVAVITPSGVTFGGWDYQDVIEDIERLTGHNIHDKD